MTILQERPHQPIFSNQILSIKEDNEYHLRIVEENNLEIEQLSVAQDLIMHLLGLGKKAIAIIKNIDKRYITLIKEEILSYLFQEDDTQQSSVNTHQSSVEESPVEQSSVNTHQSSVEESPVEQSSVNTQQSTVEPTPSPNPNENENNTATAAKTEENPTPNTTPTSTSTVSSKEKLHIEKPIVGQIVIINCTRYKGKYNGKEGVIIKIKNTNEALVKVANGKKILLKNDEMYCNFSDVILEIDILMKKLGWDVERGRTFLLEHYGKRSRHLLADAELLDFAEKLRQLVDNYQ